jgi:hypothetical protein
MACAVQLRHLQLRNLASDCQDILRGHNYDHNERSDSFLMGEKTCYFLWSRKSFHLSTSNFPFLSFWLCMQWLKVIYIPYIYLILAVDGYSTFEGGVTPVFGLTVNG